MSKKKGRLAKQSDELDSYFSEIIEALLYVQDPKELLTILFEKVQTLFPFDDVGLFEIRPDGWHRDFAVDFYTHNEISDAIYDAGFVGFLPPDEALNLLLDTTKVTSLKTLMDQFVEHPHYPYLWEGGLREFISSPLVQGNETFGVFMLWSKKAGRYTKEDFHLFNKLKDLISIVLKKLLDKETIIRQKEFSNSLLQISEAIAAVNSTKELYATIYGKIRPVFPFDEPGLFVLTAQGDQHYEIFESDFVDDSLAQIKIEENLGKHTLYETKGTATEWVIENGPVCISLKELSTFTHHPQLPLMMAGGLKQVLGGPLSYGGKVFGMICFNAAEDGFYNKEHIPMFRSISDQFGIAVSNILANEKVLSEKYFKETLLNVSKAVSTITDRKQLFKVIFEDLKALLDFDNAGLFYIDIEKDIFYEVLEEGMVDDIQDKLAQKNLLGPFTYSGAHKDALIYADEVKLFDIKEQSSIYPNPQWEVMIDEGLQKMLVSPLTLGGKKMGFISFSTKHPTLYSPENFRLIGAIAEQVSIALGNVMANENILQREKEKTQLLQITQKVSELRDIEDFLKFTTEHLKPIFEFHDTGIFLLTPDGKHHYDLVGIDPDISPSEWSFALANQGKKLVPHENSLIEWMMQGIAHNNNIALFDFKDLVNEFPDYYQFQIADFIEAGYRDCLAANLKVGDTIYGMFCMNALSKSFFDASQFTFFRNVVEQLSVAVSNILANKQLIQEKQFSDTLLKLSEAIASASDSNELYNTINETVKTVLPFDQVGVLILDSSGDAHYELINEHFSTKFSESEKPHKRTLYAHKNTSVEWLMDHGPVIVSLEKLLQRTEHPRHVDMQAAGVKTLLGGPLVNQGKKIGMLAFKSKTDEVYNEEHLLLYQAIAKQVAVTTSNILAKKEILRKNEIQRLELDISKIVTSEVDAVSKWGGVLQRLKQLIPFSHGITQITAGKESNTYHYDWVAGNEIRILDDESLANVRNSTIGEVQSLATALFNGKRTKTETVNQLSQKDGRLEETLSKMGFGAMLTLQIQLKEAKTTISCFLLAEDTEAFQREHIAVLDAIENTFSISLEKMLAAESIRMLTEQLKLEKDYLQVAVKEAYNFSDMVGESDPMQAIFKQISEVSEVDATTLILGETGTGKELIARAIHENSSRKKHVLVKVNCAAIPAQIVESELFGHEKGAFTGAIQTRIGKFELANNGTIFLDEIGEMPLELQTKLLRVIQEREVERLGSNATIKLDIRIIAATNRNLLEEVGKGKFREDLYYRLNGYPIKVPPLRLRADDILLLADFFARQFSERYALPFKGFTKNSSSRLLKYHWPGNVRELQNLLEQAIISQRGKVLEIYPGRSSVPDFDKPAFSVSDDRLQFNMADNFDMEVIKREKDKLERAYLIQILEQTKWRVSGKNGAARQLGVAPSTLESRMRKLGISRS